MNGYWGAIGFVVMGVVGVMASSGSEYRFKTESEYVSHCTTEMSKAGLPHSKSRSGCSCMYREGRALLEPRGEYELTESEADAFFDQCMGPVISAFEAEAAWNASASYDTTYDGSGWGDETNSSDWGN